MIFSIDIYNIKEQKKVTIYHKNVLTREHHELSIQVFHGIEIVFAPGLEMSYIVTSAHNLNNSSIRGSIYICVHFFNPVLT